MDNSYQVCTADSGSLPILRSAGPASQRPSPHPLGIDIGLLASLYPSLALSIRRILLSPPWMCGHPYGVDADAPTRSDVHCRALRLQWTHAMPKARLGRFQFQQPSSDTVDRVDGQILPRFCSILMCSYRLGYSHEPTVCPLFCFFLTRSASCARRNALCHVVYKNEMLPISCGG